MTRTEYYDAIETATRNKDYSAATALKKLQPNTRRDYLRDVFLTLCNGGEDKLAAECFTLLKISVDDIHLLPVLKSKNIAGDTFPFYDEKLEEIKQARVKANDEFAGLVKELYKAILENTEISDPLIATRRLILDTLVSHIKTNQGSAAATESFLFIVEYCFGSDADENLDYVTRYDRKNRQRVEIDLDNLFRNTFIKVTDNASDKELIDWYQQVVSLGKQTTYLDVLKMLSIALMRYYHMQPALNFITGYTGIGRELQVIELIRGCSLALFKGLVGQLSGITVQDKRILTLKKVLLERLAVSNNGRLRKIFVWFEYIQEFHEVNFIVTEMEDPVLVIAAEEIENIGQQGLKEAQLLINKFQEEGPTLPIRLSYRIVRYGTSDNDLPSEPAIFSHSYLYGSENIPGSLQS